MKKPTTFYRKISFITLASLSCCTTSLTSSAKRKTESLNQIELLEFEITKLDQLVQEKRRELIIGDQHHTPSKCPVQDVQIYQERLRKIKLFKEGLNKLEDKLQKEQDKHLRKSRLTRAEKSLFQFINSKQFKKAIKVLKYYDLKSNLEKKPRIKEALFNAMKGLSPQLGDNMEQLEQKAKILQLLCTKGAICLDEYFEGRPLFFDLITFQRGFNKTFLKLYSKGFFNINTLDKSGQNIVDYIDKTSLDTQDKIASYLTLGEEYKMNILQSCKVIKCLEKFVWDYQWGYRNRFKKSMGNYSEVDREELYGLALSCLAYKERKKFCCKVDQFFNKNFNKEKCDLLVRNLPTWEINPTLVPGNSIMEMLVDNKLVYDLKLRFGRTYPYIQLYGYGPCFNKKFSDIIAPLKPKPALKASHLQKERELYQKLNWYHNYFITFSTKAEKEIENRVEEYVQKEVKDYEIPYPIATVVFLIVKCLIGSHGSGTL